MLLRMNLIVQGTQSGRGIKDMSRGLNPRQPKGNEMNKTVSFSVGLVLGMLVMFVYSEFYPVRRPQVTDTQLKYGDIVVEEMTPDVRIYHTKQKTITPEQFADITGLPGVIYGDDLSGNTYKRQYRVVVYKSKAFEWDEIHPKILYEILVSPKNIESENP